MTRKQHKLLSLGIMTGTSCDGADLALLEINKKGSQVHEKLLLTYSRKFPKQLRSKLLTAQKDKLHTRQQAFLEHEYSSWIAELCATLIKIKKIPTDKLIISIHGQTLWHEPPVSVQIIDPAILSAKTGCTVLTKFRQGDLARAGHGAPLVPYYHWLKARSVKLFDAQLPFAIHNLGGIANLTVLTKNPRQMIGFDTGPANALIDLAVNRFTKGSIAYDKNGAIALSEFSKINWTKIKMLAKHPFFKMLPPKSTGKELFNEAFLEKILKFSKNSKIAIANATAFTAYSMALAYSKFVLKKVAIKKIYLAGGGANNRALILLFQNQLKQLTGKYIEVSPLPKTFADVEYLEAMAFARFGYEALIGNTISLKNITGAKMDSSEALICIGKNYRTLLQSILS